MLYKRWILSLLKIILIVYFSLFIVINLIIDPYGEFNLFKFEFNKFKTFTSYDTFPFKLLEKLKNNKYILVFGTSRSQLINSDLAKENILNFSSSLYGNPVDVYNVIRQVNKKQLKNIKEIWYLIDTHTFNSKNSVYANLNLHSKKDFITQSISNLNIDKIKASYRTITSNLNKNNTYYISQYGETIKIKEKVFDGIIGKNDIMRIPITTKKAIKYLSKVDEFCKKNSIKITYFTTIYNLPYLKTCDLNLYKNQFKDFLSVIDGFYDFHYVKNLSNNIHLFSNHDHINTEGTTYLIDLLRNRSDDYLVTKKILNIKY